MQDQTLKLSVKKTIFSDSEVLNLGVEALRPDTLRRIRQLAWRLGEDGKGANPESDRRFLEGMGLVQQGPGGTWKLTRAALLLFGRADALQEVMPDRHTEVTAQLLDPEGYDFQETLKGNLIEAYGFLMGFVARNFPPGDALATTEGSPSGADCVRDLLFGEMISNLIIHRDYSVRRPARVTFQADRHTFENPADPRKGGVVDLAWSESSPQNPLLYRFFQNMGWIASSGQGLKMLLRYGEAYFGTRILAFDREIFKVIATSNVEFPVAKEITGKLPRFDASSLSAMQVKVWKKPDIYGFSNDSEPILKDTMQAIAASMQAGEAWDPSPEPQPERVRRILSFCESPRNREEIQKHVGLNNRDHFRKEILLPLLHKGLLQATLPDKPNSPKQKYRTAPAFVSREP